MPLWVASNEARPIPRSSKEERAFLISTDFDWNHFGHQVLRATFNSEPLQSRRGRPPLLLTAAVSAGIDTIQKGYEIPQLDRYSRVAREPFCLPSVNLSWRISLCRFLDFVNLMSYDLHGAWENYAAHSSPLRSNNPNDRLTVVSAKQTNHSALTWNETIQILNKPILGKCGEPYNFVFESGSSSCNSALVNFLLAGTGSFLLASKWFATK